MVTPTNVRVRVNGAFALLQNDLYTVAGCPFQIPIGTGTKPQPCVTVQWQAPATMVKIGGQTVLLETSVGLCQSAEQIVQGMAIVTGAQMKVRGI